MPRRAMCKDGVEDERFFVEKKVMFDVVGERVGEEEKVEKEEEEEEEEEEEGVMFGVLKNSSSWSDVESSNSDLSENCLEKSGDGEEVHSSALPRRRGLSRFYNGKSRGFANLFDAISVKDLAKPDYTRRKRRRRAIAKRPTTSSATTLALCLWLWLWLWAVAMTNSNSPPCSSSLTDLQQCEALAISNGMPVTKPCG